MFIKRLLLFAFFSLVMTAFVFLSPRQVNAQTDTLCVTFSMDYYDPGQPSGTGGVIPTVVFKNCQTGELLLVDFDWTCPSDQRDYDTGGCKLPVMQPDNGCYLLSDPILSDLNYPLFVVWNDNTQENITISRRVSGISGFTRLNSCQDCPAAEAIATEVPTVPDTNVTTPAGATQEVTSNTPELLSPGNGLSLPEGVTIRFTWSGQGAAFLLESDESPYESTIRCEWQAEKSCMVGPLIAGTYSWHVKARDSSGQESPWSQASTFTIESGGITLVPISYASDGQEATTCNFFCSVKIFLVRSWSQLWGRKLAPPAGVPVSAPAPQTVQQAATIQFQAPVTGPGICIGSWGPGMGDHLNADYYAIDYIGPAGTSVRPTLAGTVVFSGWVSDGYGYVVAIRSGGVQKSDIYYYSIYAHLNPEGLPAVNTTADKNTIIGTMGDSGTDNVHLHFAVRSSDHKYDGAQALYGQSLNPRKIFTPAFNVREKLDLTPQCPN